ncbi:MAG TPA: GatB/YqeY domain-containing protein [Candidatus Saccharimonadales bacterium]|nr:GatB/YqeY domain-containing protein [Candidatus Saccharimonadales bacterium]
MALKQRIQDDLKAALLGGDRFAAETLRGLKAAILNEEVAKSKRDEGLEDAEIEQIVAKEVKKRNESATLYEQNDRAESAADERREAEILSIYLPTQLGEEEVKAIIEAAIKQLGANGMSDMGKVIGVVKSKVGNTADGATVAKLVKEQLTQ